MKNIDLHYFLDSDLEKELIEKDQFHSAKVILESEKQFVNMFSEHSGNMFLYVSGFFFKNRFEPQYVFINNQKTKPMTLYNLFVYFKENEIL